MQISKQCSAQRQAMSLLNMKSDSRGWVGEPAQLEGACLAVLGPEVEDQSETVSDHVLYQFVLDAHHPMGRGWEHTPWTGGMRTELT